LYFRDVARLARQAAEALAHAHSSDVLHLDIKPSNLMIDQNGELWITDFGLARVLGGMDLTQSGDALGTPRYMSPEQALGRRTPLDGRTDIYSLGVTIYELLTLLPAFAGDDRLEMLRQIAQDEPVPPRQLDPRIPADLETIVLKAMAKSPADRYPTAAELATDLGRFLDRRSILARRPSFADRGAKWMLRHRRLVAGLTAAASSIAVLLAYAGWHYTELLRAHNAALEAAVARADEHAEKAERLLHLADRHAFASTLRLAGQAIRSRQFETAQDLLDSSRAGSDGQDLRDFAWHYLHRLSRRELVRLPEQDAKIYGLSLPRDGRTMASLHMDSSIVLWDLPSESPRLRIAEPGFGYRMPRLSGDGRILVARRSSQSADSVHDLGIWDAATGRLRSVRRAGSFPPGRYSEDENTIYLVDRERRVAHVWAYPSGQISIRIWPLDFDAEKQQPDVVLAGVNAVAFASQGPSFATRAGARLTLRDVSSGAVVRDCPGTCDEGERIALSPDGRLLAMASRAKGIQVRAVNDGELRSRYDVSAPVITLAFDPVGGTIAAVDENGRIHLCDLSSGRVRVVTPDEMERRRDEVHLSFSTDGALLATTSHGSPGGHQPMAFWDVKSGAPLATLPSRSQGACSPSFASDGRSVVVDLERAPRIWHFKPAVEPPSPAGHKDEAWAVAFSPDGALLATGSDDTTEPHTIKLWDPATGQLIRGWDAGMGTVASLVFSPEGRILASGHLTLGNNVRLWDISTGRLLHTLHGHKGVVRAVAFAPGGKTLASAGGYQAQGGEDWAIRVWDVEAATCLRQLEDHSATVRSLAFSPDGGTLATVSHDKSLKLWDAATGRLLRTARGPDMLVAVAFAPDGKTLAAAAEPGTLTIRHAVSLDVLNTIRHENSEVLRDLAIAPDGRSVATCGMSGRIRLWDTLTGQELLTLEGHKAQINGVAFAPDTSSLASCSHDGEVKLWRAGP
jgi:WD40 repeat protein